GDQVRGAGTAGGEADADLAGELGVRAGHEGGHLLVAHLHEVDPVLRPLQGAQRPVYPVSGVAKDAPDAPSMQALDEEVADGLAHERQTAERNLAFRSFDEDGRVQRRTV